MSGTYWGASSRNGGCYLSVSQDGWDEALRFRWTTFDVTGLLPGGWRDDVLAVAVEADFRDFPRTPVLSREAEDVRYVPRGRVHADRVRRRLPWLYASYQGYFLDLAAHVCTELVSAARDGRYGVVLNVQRGTGMRFECHIDSNPLTGLLFCTDHPAGGGELVFAHDPAAADVGAVERDCSVIRPHAGHLIFFNGSKNPHYARPLVSEAETRVVAVMNFYTGSCPESTRPPELNRHLYGSG
jgi:2OG-Fe(II) oxygenase superfamily